MKKELHPTYYTNSKAKCACGSIFEVGSTVESFGVEICSACHPFYSGTEKVIDTAGRVERFKKMQAASAKLPKKTPKAKRTREK
ncbi:MAG: RpmE: 50S ribosomal protein L31 [Candidatus Nomurabacteria bacterium GW2011_GWB1_37_5]|uniref:Large ribosomal subunit protein bL31 n=1 Tax=Candidatus Nomurabacteria bacterium GW2011_GWB1_37_5 TaxID=1618742 RepID=A0A0G0H7B7_9BACT|nr:MAG: RpmE: 50S ribosomal protein L31 [Candidatus Nomurabacteria bacterium GW2011_GWB1_37_5]